MHYPCQPTRVEALHRRYVQELILVAARGKGDLRGLFLERYREQLGALSSWLPHLGAAEMAAAFDGALEAQEERVPGSLLSYRLALPRWFASRVKDSWAPWRAYRDYRPRDVVVDPVCLMFLDVDLVSTVTERAGEKVYFCSPYCQSAFDGHHPDSPAAAHAARA